LTPPTVRVDAASWAMAGEIKRVKSIRQSDVRNIAKRGSIIFLFRCVVFFNDD
jgi:hypothetical protein